MENLSVQENPDVGSKDEKMMITDLNQDGKYGSTHEFKLDESGGVAGVKSFEDLLEIVGTSGRWNYVLFFICSMCTFISPLQSITYEFLGATPDHWCHVAPLVDANWTQEQIFNLAIPSKNGTDIEDCKVNHYNYTLAVELGYEAAMENLDLISIDNGTAIHCYSRDFNTSQYKSTVVTEWDLVCERRALYSTTQAASQGGILLGSLIFGYLSDMFGRRPMILLAVVMSLITGFGAALSPDYILYIVLRTLVSSFNFGFYTGCFVHVMELCSTKQRSSVGSMFVMPWAFGYMLVPGIAYFIRSWRWLQAAYTLPTIFLFSYFWLLPESPRWLISEGRYEEAVEVLAAAAKANKRTLPPSEAIIVSMKSMLKPKEEKPKITGVHLMASKLKQVFILVIKSDLRVKALICYFCWCSVSMVYYGVSLNSGNLSTDPYLYVFLGGLVEVPSYLMLWPMLAYLGRKISLITLYLVCAVTIFIIAILLATLDEVSTGVLMFLSLSGKLAITAAFHLLYVFTAELFPTKYRSLAVGESSMMARVGSIVSPFINDLLGDAVKWGPSALFAAVSVLAAGLSLILPETRGTDLTEENAFDKQDQQENSKQQTRGRRNEAFEPS